MKIYMCTVYRSLGVEHAGCVLCVQKTYIINSIKPGLGPMAYPMFEILLQL